MSDAVAGKRYVVGFMFDVNENDVLLIRKTHPEWQKGRLNGVGGEIEPGESASEAMQREFNEEVGIHHRHWREFCVLGDARQWQIHFFYADGPIWAARPMTDERPEIACIRALPSTVIPNLHWLIPMALTMRDERVDGFLITEAEGASWSNIPVLVTAQNPG